MADEAAQTGTRSLAEHLAGIEWETLEREDLETLALDEVPEVRERAVTELARFDADELEELAAPVDPDGAFVAALARAQAAFPPIAKTKTAVVTAKPGKAGYSYRYADLADVLAAVRPVIARHGLALVQKTVYVEGKLHLVTSLRHTAGGREESLVELGKSPSDPQGFGGSLTYLRRYEAVTLLGIQADEDADAHNVSDLEQGGAPAWATTAATTEQKGKALAGLEAALGHRGTATEFGKALAARTGGSMPAVVAAWLGALPSWLTAAERNRMKDAAEAERTAQDVAAEQPDPPAPDVGADPEVDEDGLDVATPVDGLPSDPSYPVTPPAGSVDAPPDNVLKRLPSDDARRAAIASAGCICDDPLDGGDNDACPIRGHGIPF